MEEAVFFLFFFESYKSAFHGMGFPTVYDMTLTNELQLLIILEPRTDIWVGQVVDGSRQILFEISLTWAFQWYMTRPNIMNLVILGPWANFQVGEEVGGASQFLLALKHSRSVVELLYLI